MLQAMSIPVQPRHTLRNYSWVHKAYIQKGAPVKATGFTGNPPRAKWLSNPKVHGRGVELEWKWVEKTKTLESAEFARGDQFMLQSIISAREINICIE